MYLTMFTAIAFVAGGLLMLLSKNRIPYRKTLGTLSLIAGIMYLVFLLAFRVNWKTDDDRYVPTEQVSKSEPNEKVSKGEIEEKQEIKIVQVSYATKELWALTRSLIRSDKKQYKRLATKANRLIKDGADVNFTNQRISSLYYAAQSDHAGIVKLLLDAGANANATNYDGNTPLWTASSHGYTKIVKLLMKAGADVNKPGRDDEPPLWIAARRGHVEVVRLLIAAKADVNSTNPKNVTPLHAACYDGHTKTVELLLAAGAELEIVDHDPAAAEGQGIGSTALITAVALNHTEVVRLLVKAGANVIAVNDDSKTAMSYARQAGNNEIVKILKAHGARR